MVEFSHDDLEEFAKWCGVDSDTFYESYYDIDYYDDYEVELEELGHDSQA